MKALRPVEEVLLDTLAEIVETAAKQSTPRKLADLDVQLRPWIAVAHEVTGKDVTSEHVLPLLESTKTIEVEEYIQTVIE